MLFMTPMCPNCAEIKGFIVTRNIRGEIVDATTDEGLSLAQKHNVDHVPTVLFFAEGQKISEAYTIDDVKKVLENKSISQF